MSHRSRSSKAKMALERLLHTIEAENASLAARLRSFFDKAEAQGLVLVPPERPETCSIMLKSGPEEDALNFGWFGYCGRNGQPFFRNYGIAKTKEGALCPRGADYLHKLADLFHADVYPSPKDPFEMTVKRRTNQGWVYVSIDEVLIAQDKWVALIQNTRARFSAQIIKADL